MNFKYIFFFYIALACCQNCQLFGSGQPKPETVESLIEQWFSATKTLDLIRIKDLVSKIDINCRNKKGETALICEPYLRSEGLVEYFLQVPGIDVNAQDDHGFTVLMNAAYYGRKNIVEQLLQVPNININAQNKSGRTALIYAIAQDRTEIAKMLIKAPNIDVNIHTDGITPLMFAASHGHTDIVELLLGVPEINVNAQRVHGKNTALMEAALNDNSDIVALLVNHPKTNLYIKNEYGETAAQIAEGKHLFFVANDINNKINELTLLAFEAIKFNNLELLKSIIVQVGDKISDINGNTLLDKAFLANKHEIILFLLQKSDDPRESLARFQFEQLSPSTEIFEYIMHLAYGQEYTPSRIVTDVKDKSDRSEEQSSKSKLCSFCSKAAFMLCGKCKKVYYCCRACQKADWKSHKQTC